MPKKRDPHNIAEISAKADNSQSLPQSSESTESPGKIQLANDIAEQLSRVVKDYVQRKALYALGYIRRRELLHILRKGPKGTKEIRNKLNQKVSVPNIKGHLDVLASTRLVSIHELTFALTPIGDLVSNFMQHIEAKWLDVFSTEEGSTKRCKILDFLNLRDASKFDEIASAFDINKSEVHRFLKSLVNAGLVEKGCTRFDPYSLTNDGRHFLESVEQLTCNLASLFVETIARDNERGMVHLFLVSPTKGFVMIDKDELVLSIRDGELSRIE